MHFDEKAVVSKVDLPDRSLVAQLTLRATGGAAGDLTHAVYVSKAGDAGSPELMFYASGDCTPKISWESDTLLWVRYTGGVNCNVLLYNSVWHDDGLRRGIDTRFVEIALARQPSTH